MTIRHRFYLGAIAVEFHALRFAVERARGDYSPEVRAKYDMVVEATEWLRAAINDLERAVRREDAA